MENVFFIVLCVLGFLTVFNIILLLWLYVKHTLLKPKRPGEIDLSRSGFDPDDW